MFYMLSHFSWIVLCMILTLLAVVAALFLLLVLILIVASFVSHVDILLRVDDVKQCCNVRFLLGKINVLNGMLNFQNKQYIFESLQIFGSKKNVLEKQREKKIGKEKTGKIKKVGKRPKTAKNGKQKSAGKTMNKIKTGNRLMNIFLKNIRMECFIANVLQGTGDAAVTAVMSGAYYTAFEILFFVLTFQSDPHKNRKLKEKHVDIRCDYANPKVFLDFHCIFQLKIVNIIFETLKSMAKQWR